MSRLRSRAPLAAISCRLCLLALGLFTLAAAGCASQDVIEPQRYEDAFGDEFEPDEITADSVAEETMLRQHAQFDLSVGAAIPLESNFEIAASLNGKFSYEIAKRLYAGLAFGWARHDVKDGATSGVSTTNPAGDITPDDPTRAYDNFDRFSILAMFDYDLPLTRPSGDFGAWTLRLGLGAGMLIIDGEEDKFLATQNALAGNSYAVQTFYGFLVRPTVEIRWRVWEHGHVFAGVSYDYTPQQRINVKTAGERREVNSDIQFDAFNAAVGFSLEW